jgi:hypothetical protein
MKKVNRGIAAMGLLLLLCILGSSCPLTSQEVHQQTIVLDGFEIMLSDPEVEFPDSINFNIEVESDAVISGIALHYQVDRRSPIPVTSVTFPEFEPETRVKTSLTLDLTQFGGLPPGTELGYWWSIEDAQGDSVDTSAAELVFDDERYSWKSLASGQITLLWYQGDDYFAQSLMSAAQQALGRLAGDTGAELEGEATLYIYADYDDLRGALIYPQEWTGGVAYTEFDTIAIGISTGNLSWGKGAIAHELAHLAVHQFIYNGYGVELPTWLDEGLAMYAQGGISSGMWSALNKAIDEDTLFSVKSLCSPFPAQTTAANLAYAQSYSLVEYLLEEQGGQENMLELLNAFKQGSGYVEALDEVYGLDVEQLNTLWREYVGV